MAVTRTNIILKTAEDWPKFDRAFQTKAVSYDLWDHIKEDSPKALLVEPEMPEPESFKAPPPEAGPAQSTRASAPASATPPASTGLNADESRNFQIAWNIYTVKEKAYSTQRANIRSLTDWVLEAVAQRYVDSSYVPTESLHEWYKKLKEHAGIRKGLDKKIARDKYQQAVTPLKKPPKDWNTWLDTWEEAISTGLQKDLFEAKDSSVWCDDFLGAIKLVLPS